jgi:glycosyltransferase involved in cell wall biosynthesis
MTLARSRGVLNDTLFMRDPIPKSEMPHLLAAADVTTSFCAPIEALWANSANKFFDGLAAGRPVLINHGGWLADLLEESGAGLVVPPGDPGAAAAQLASFLEDSARVELAREAARRLARERFDRDMLAQKMTRLIEDVAAAQRSEGAAE